jgi:hypothetical protein
VRQAVDEFILYLNDRNPETEAAVERYTRPPFNIKIMGDKENHGITRPINWLFGNASNEHVLFLEKDFQLVESLECAAEQIEIGVNMIKVRRVVCGVWRVVCGELSLVGVGVVAAGHLIATLRGPLDVA